METLKNRILLIYSSDNECFREIYEFLKNNSFDVLSTTNADQGIKMVKESYADLIICQYKLKKVDGFQAYNIVRRNLLYKAIPFFLYMCKFRKEFILKGLELGIDNFIIAPYNKTLLLKKIENQLNKRKKLNIYNSEKFRHIFETIPVARCISKNENIIMINNEFSRLTGIKKDLTTFPKFSDVFDFSDNQNDSSNFYKCISGLNDYCLLNHIPLTNNKSTLFDIYMMHSNYFGNNIFFSDLITCTESDKNREFEDRAAVKLTLREKEIFKYSMQGLEIKQIAAKLKISCRTVEKHRSNIMEKTGTSNIVEAIFYFYKRNSLSQFENNS
jgi:DNA-binding NarL/FixJ family response regulator